MDVAVVRPLCVRLLIDYLDECKKMQRTQNRLEHGGNTTTVGPKGGNAYCRW